MSDFVVNPRYTCTLGGALSVVRALPGKVIPIIHAASGCGGNLGYATANAPGHCGSGYCSAQAVPSTGVGEKELIFGGTDRLREEIANGINIMDGELFVVMTACMVDMIGDDSESVVKEFSEYSKPILFVETGGFKGNSYKGYDLIMSMLAKDYVTKAEKKEEKTINLLGVVPIQDVFWQSDLTILKNLLEELGLKVNTFFGDNETLDNLKQSGKASRNIVLSNVYGIDTAKVYEQTHDIPYSILNFPIGDGATTEFIREIADIMDISSELAESVIRRHKKHYYNYLERLADLYTDSDMQRYVVVIGDSNLAPAYTRFLADDLGWIPELCIVTDILNDSQKTKVSSCFGNYKACKSPEIRFNTHFFSANEILNEIWPQKTNEIYYNSFEPAFVLGSTLDRDFANSINAKHLSVSYPINDRVVLNRGYAGYLGGINLAEDIFTKLTEGW